MDKKTITIYIDVFEDGTLENAVISEYVWSDPEETETVFYTLLNFKEAVNKLLEGIK